MPIGSNVANDSHTERPSGFSLVTVFRARDAGHLAIAKSMLQSAQVEFATRNEEVQDIFGWGRFPRGRNLAMGLVELQVRQEDAEFAKQLLSSLSGDSEDNEAI